MRDRHRRAGAPRLALLLGLTLAVACDRDEKQGTPPAVAERPDSAGWRFVSIPGARVTVAYPLARVRHVALRWTDDCDSTAAFFPNTDPDGAPEEELVIAAARTPEAAARAANFEPVDDEHTTCLPSPCGAGPWQPGERPHWNPDHYEMPARIGAWTVLHGTWDIRGYFDVVPDSEIRASRDDPPDYTRPPEAMYQARFVASRPIPSRSGCRLVLAWNSRAVHELRGGADSARMDSALFAHLLAGVELGAARAAPHER